MQLLLYLNLMYTGRNYILDYRIANCFDLVLKGPDYKVTESMYIEKFFNVVNKEGAEGMMRKEWQNNFVVMDTDQDGKISKAEHQCFFEALYRKQMDPNGAIVAFSAIDKDMDGVISCDEYVEAGMEFFFNLSDETKPSKYFFGPLVKTYYVYLVPKLKLY